METAQGRRSCELCRGTGYYGDNGPGMRGNREWVPCEKCNPTPDKNPRTALQREQSRTAEIARVAAALAAGDDVMCACGSTMVIGWRIQELESWICMGCKRRGSTPENAFMDAARCIVAMREEVDK